MRRADLVRQGGSVADVAKEMRSILHPELPGREPRRSASCTVVRVPWQDPSLLLMTRARLSYTPYHGAAP